MTRHVWTARHCYEQLRIVGVKLSLSPDGKNLKIKAPGDLNLQRMIPVIRKYKPGLVRILREAQSPKPRPARAGIPPTGMPAGMKKTVEAVMAEFADMGVEVVDVRRVHDIDDGPRCE